MLLSNLSELLPYLTSKEKEELDRLLAAGTPRWIPLPGPQTEAFTNKADILFYGGAAGGGKTDLLLGLASTHHTRSILFRREYPQLKAIEDRARELFGSDGKYNGTDKIWSLTDKKRIEFGAVQHPGDEQKYQGRPHDLKGFDEIAHFKEMQFRFLSGWLRSKDPAQRCRIIATGNPPTDAEGEWIIQFWGPWLDPQYPRPAKPGELRWFTTLDGKDREVENETPFIYKGERITPKSRTFIPAKVEDNPYYVASGYVATLQALPEPLRSKMLYGSFAAGREDTPYQVIPTEWVKQAQARWESETQPDITLTSLGVDVARGGSDRTVITPRYGHWCGKQWIYPGSATPNGGAVAALVLNARGNSKAMVYVDVIGVGASVYDILQATLGEYCIPLNGSEGSNKTEKSGQLSFLNQRAEWWWLFRELLDPESGQDIALPPARELLSDLCAPRWKLSIRGIQVESKEDIIKRIGRSPDLGDSCVYAYVTKYLHGSGLLAVYAEEYAKRQKELYGFS